MLPFIHPNQPIAIDLETCDPEMKFTAPGFISKVGFVAGVAIRASEGAFYLPIGHTEGQNYDKEELIKWLNFTLSGDTEKVFHNAQYDLGWLDSVGVQVHGKIFDTMLAAPLINENRYTYTLDSLGKEYFQEGKYEEALRLAVAAKFGGTRTHKVIIRLKEDSDVLDYTPFKNAKVRVTQLYELWPKEVQDRYEVLGYQKSKNGQELFLVPTKSDSDIKALLWAIDPEEMGSYPIQDVNLTYRLYLLFKEKLKEEKLDSVADLENELLPALLEMRKFGVRIDMKKAVELDKKYTKTLHDLQKALDRLAGFEVNVNIDDDLIRICDKFNLKYQKTDKGNPSFTKETVPKDEHGIFDNVIAIRNMYKARDTYIRGYLFGSTLDGWLHGQYNQLKSDEGGTVTGRLSSSNPNMQNMPNPKSSQIGKDIRGCFLPDNDDEKWLSMDYSGQEPKMLVHGVLALAAQLRRSSTNERVLDLNYEVVPGERLARSPEFSGREADFHTAVAGICMKRECDLTHQEYEPGMAKEFRPKAKSIGLGVMYGSGDRKVAEEMTKKGFPMTKDQAHDIRQNIYAGVPFLNYFNRHVMRKARDNGYITTIAGRRGRFAIWECPCYDKAVAKEIGSANFGFKTITEAYAWYNEAVEKYGSKIEKPTRAGIYKALNKFIQGSSADQTKTAMVHLYKRGNLDLKALDIYYRRIEGFTPPKFKTQVHDEINVSKTKDEDEHWYQDIMENCIKLNVEVVAEPVVCDNWAEAK